VAPGRTSGIGQERKSRTQRVPGPQRLLPRGKSTAAGQRGDTGMSPLALAPSCTLECHSYISPCISKALRVVLASSPREQDIRVSPQAEDWACFQWEFWLPSPASPHPQGLSHPSQPHLTLAGRHEGSRLEFQGCHTCGHPPSPRSQACYIMFRALSHCRCLWRRPQKHSHPTGGRKH
jgi:hypothetical protein